MVLLGQQETVLEIGFVSQCHLLVNTRQHLFETVKYILLPIREIHGLQELITDHGMAFQYHPQDNTKQQLHLLITLYGPQLTMV